MIIAVDFDGTIVEHRYPKIGKPIPFAIPVLKQLMKDKHQLILWTVREGKQLQEAIDYCHLQGVFFYAHNANFPDEDRKKSPRKLTADLFIDDRNFGGLPNWGLIYQAILERRALQNKLDFNSEMSLFQELNAKDTFWKKLFK